MIVDHDNPAYRRRWGMQGANRWNGAYYYSIEIVRNIIPRVETDRNWVTVNQKGEAFDHSIVFVHNNLHPENYDWLSSYDDLVLVCGVPSTCGKVAHLGKAVYLPLSVDVDAVRLFRCRKDRDIGYFGRSSKKKGCTFEEGTDFISGLKGDRFLATMARYERVYAVGRTAIEAKVLGCEVLPYDPRYPDPGFWKVVDNREAAAMLQAILDEVDG